MITGVVNNDLEAIIPVFVQDASGRMRQTEALVDTGFNGYLLLTNPLVVAFGLKWSSRQPGRLADGSYQLFDVYSATLEWDGQARAVEVEVGDFKPLVGTGLLAGYELKVKMIDGGAVTVEAIP